MHLQNAEKRRAWTSCAHQARNILDNVQGTKYGTSENKIHLNALTGRGTAPLRTRQTYDSRTKTNRRGVTQKQHVWQVQGGVNRRWFAANLQRQGLDARGI